jgi:hypothetical protein
MMTIPSLFAQLDDDDDDDDDDTKPVCPTR